ncbi:MAG: hypothetical protein ACRD8O_21435, partial [Bryobacteraceae bacterium]
PTLVHAEGLAERMGDIVFSCSGGAPGSVVTGNLTFFLSVNVTNRVSSTNVLDTRLTVNTGSGPVAANVPGTLTSTNAVAYNGLSFTVPASGQVGLRLTNLRGAANVQGIGVDQPIRAAIALNASNLAISSSNVIVGFSNRGMLATYATSGIRCAGSPLPPTLNLESLFQAGTRFASTRVTEGYADSFRVKEAEADSGVRIIARFTGMPKDARLFVPDVIAGSGAVQPTSGGDLGLARAVGIYAPAAVGSLLLARVTGADSNGGGGRPVYTPGPAGSGAAVLNAVSEITLANGAGSAVYEVVDSNPSVRESAQFPTFIGLPPITDGTNAVAQETVMLAPVSTVASASGSASIPRFAATAPASDCTELRDCDAAYFPRLVVNQTPIEYNVTPASTFQTRYVQVRNEGGGLLDWKAAIFYKTATNWLTADPASGTNNGTVRVDAFPARLAVGSYEATLQIDGGPLVGSKTVPITLTVTAAPAPQPAPPPPAPAPPKVSVRGMFNLARPESNVIAPGSLATIRGERLNGSSVVVTLDGIPATVLSPGAERIDVHVPAALSGKNTARLEVAVDGEKSAPFTVSLAEIAPAIFPGGLINEDGAANAEATPALTGSVLQIYGTGVLAPVPGPVTVKLHDRFLTPLWAGFAPGFAGLNQINVSIPEDLPTMTTEVLICGQPAQAAEPPVCSVPAKVTLRRVE